MLPILAKDEAKQKEIEARAAQTVLEEQRANEAKKLMSPKGPSGQQAKSPMSAKKMAMKIQPIPSFDALKKKKPQPPTLAVPETAKQDIALGTSPPASDTSTAVQPAPKLNPKATTFSFKPNPSATAFTPGGPSSAVLPAATSATAAHSAAAPVAAPTAPATERVVSPAAGPSNVAPQVVSTLLLHLSQHVERQLMQSFSNPMHPLQGHRTDTRTLSFRPSLAQSRSTYVTISFHGDTVKHSLLT